MTKLTLYGYYRSSCTTRLRIALALKKIEHTTVVVDFFNKEHRGAAYTAINPNQSLPTLAAEIEGSGGGTPVYITQSVAALEFLEEAFPDNAVPLLPKNPADRARVRSLVEIVVADLQPRQANHTLEKLGNDLGADGDQKTKWAYDWSVRELRAYETLVTAGGANGGPPGKYSVGDTVTLADVCLVPAIQNAVERWGVDLEKEFPVLAKIFGNLTALPEVQGAHWSKQPDAPKDA
ncbi:maleylacetoacetate isomerase [Sporothrix schenckii 1099-18]|uniref:Maleylacetoacetate isomerase n=2 Tax=Sporothrix schenckii TaxID=29908 RepID=U7PSM0_SPOS1|nr:maleylacetoacetate isomerase [Sporothrix schenckii 1099-18]ERS98648.1 maleylacetoacetate isomerase [Sporothrix schenckii ATCC 58251]KJR89170.1 maleylacetoacetate isomerase [Sporothrix schenckii 1099-18]